MRKSLNFFQLLPSLSLSTDNPTPVPDLCDFKPTDHKEVGEIIRN